MSDIMIINGQRARIRYDGEADVFRGCFLDLNGGADFYADSVVGLKAEGAESLKVFLEICAENGITPLLFAP